MQRKLRLQSPPEQVEKKRFEPERVIVFVAVKRFENDVRVNHRRSRGVKMENEIPAIVAFEGGCDVSLEREAAFGADRRFDKTHTLPPGPTTGANNTSLRCGGHFVANLANVRIKKTNEGLGKVFYWRQ